MTVLYFLLVKLPLELVLLEILNFLNSLEYLL